MNTYFSGLIWKKLCAGSNEISWPESSNGVSGTRNRRNDWFIVVLSSDHRSRTMTLFKIEEQPIDITLCLKWLCCMEQANETGLNRRTKHNHGTLL